MTNNNRIIVYKYIGEFIKIIEETVIFDKSTFTPTGKGIPLTFRLTDIPNNCTNITLVEARFFNESFNLCIYKTLKPTYELDSGRVLESIMEYSNYIDFAYSDYPDLDEFYLAVKKFFTINGTEFKEKED